MTALKPPVPEGLILHVELTTVCQCNCLICPRHIIPKQRSLGHMTDETRKLLLDRIDEHPEKVNKVSLCGFGEPLCYPHVYSFLEELIERQPGISINIDTNGVFLNEDATYRIIDLGIKKLKISINFPTPTLYKKYKKSNTYDKTMRNIIRLLNIKGNRKPEVEVRYMSFPETLPQLREAIKFWGPHLNSNDYIHVHRLDNWMGLLDVSKFGVKYVTWEESIEKGIWSHCIDLSMNFPTISKEGNFLVCCASIILHPDDPFNLGNIKDHSIMELNEIRK